MSVTLILKKSNITTETVDAVVNAASEEMLGGGGVDGSIHRAAGPKLLDACRAVPEVSPGVRCPTGQAHILPGFDLPAKYVINTVGPVYQDATTSAPLLSAAYSNSLQLARREDIQSIAFPAISCGVYGYPLKDAALLALKTASECVKKQDLGLEKIIFALFTGKTFKVWVEAARELGMQALQDLSQGDESSLIWRTKLVKE